jgi:hypothetical protein
MSKLKNELNDLISKLSDIAESISNGDLVEIEENKTKVICGFRQSGKTTKLIIMSAQKQIPIVVRNTAIGFCIEERARNMGLEIPKPITFGQITIPHLARGRTINSVLIDDVDYFIRMMIKTTGRNGYRTSIEAMTITGDINEKEL